MREFRSRAGVKVGRRKGSNGRAETQEITHRIQQGGRIMQRDLMEGAWVSDMLLDAGRGILSP